MAGRMARRAALMVLGVLAAATALIGLGQTRIQRSCGHRQPALSFLASKLELGDRSHDEVEAAAKRWTKERTAEDFTLILDHLSRGTPAKQVRATLGEPDRLSYLRLDPGHAQNHHEHWTYHLDRGFLGVVTTDFQEEVVVEARVERTNSCLAAGTPVLTERGEVPVEGLRPEDRIWGFDLSRRERVLARV